MGLYVGTNPVRLSVNQNNLHFNYYKKPPTLAESMSWYKGNTRRGQFTEINIVNNYIPTGNETEEWNADENNDGSIKCYVNDNILIIAGNGAKKIKLNSNSINAFSNPVISGSARSDAFTRVVSITGLSIFDTSNVTDMDGMFYRFSSLTSLDVSNWDTSNVTSMGNMFRQCKKLTSLDLSNFNTSNVTSMNYMFNSSFNLTTIYVSNLWSTDAVINSQYMFYNCTSLVGNIAYNSSYVDKTYATVTGGYLTYKPSSGNNLFTFTICGTSYQAIDGMTWAEWGESEYNDGKVTYHNGNMLFNDFYIVTSGANAIKSSSYIFAMDYVINDKLS